MEVFNTHKFLFTLYYNDEIKGKKILFIDRDNKEKEIIIVKIDIGSSPVSCKLYDNEENRYLVPFIKIRKIYNENGEMIWDNTDSDLSNVKVIKGYD